MGFMDSFLVASMPVLRVLSISGVGSFLAKDGVNILDENARKCLSTLLFFVFEPAFIISNLSRTLTWDSLVLSWYMPLNIVITFAVGSALGWILLKLTKPPQHLKGLVVGVCSAGNIGGLFQILVPAMCKESGSPFGEPDICYKHSIAYASLSEAVLSICVWTYIYNIIRVSSNVSINNAKVCSEASEPLESNCIEEPLLTHNQVNITVQAKQQLMNMLRESINIKALFAPSTIGTLVGFIVGIVPQLRTLMNGVTAPLRVIGDSAKLIGSATIPTNTLIIGANLLRGLKGSGAKFSVVVGIVVVRYILLPLIGIVVVRGAISFGLVPSDPVYQFVLLLQFAAPPAMNIGIITQLFGTGQSECSVIMLWTYSLAPVSLTLWSTVFMFPLLPFYVIAHLGFYGCWVAFRKANSR